MGANLWKSECYGLDSEQKKVPNSSPGALTCVLIHLGAFWSLLAHLPSQKSILPYFSSPRGVAVSVSFPEARIRKETVSGLGGGGFEGRHLELRVHTETQQGKYESEQAKKWSQEPDLIHSHPTNTRSCCFFGYNLFCVLCTPLRSNTPILPTPIYGVFQNRNA